MYVRTMYKGGFAITTKININYDIIGERGILEQNPLQEYT